MYFLGEKSMLPRELYFPKISHYLVTYGLLHLFKFRVIDIIKCPGWSRCVKGLVYLQLTPWTLFVFFVV